jgi:phosphatidylglycerophosphate synthase
MLPRFSLTDDVARSPKKGEAAGRRSAGRTTATTSDRGQRATASPAALLFATAPSGDGGPAAALEVLGTTLICRLLSQLASLGVRVGWIATRPEWRETIAEAVAASGVEAAVLPAQDIAEDMRLTAELASQARGTLVVADAHVLTHREALAGLLADPRIVSGVLMTGSPVKGYGSLAIRSLRGRVVSAESSYHRVQDATGHFLGLIKIDERDTDRLGAAAARLGELAAERPAGWDAELDRKESEWRLLAWRAAVERETGTLPDRTEAPDPASLRIDGVAEKAITLRRRAAPEDAVSLLLVGLVRSDVDLFPSPLREFFHAAPLSREEAVLAAEDLSRIDEGHVLLNSAVKANDGFFTTYFVSPYSKYLARFGARRGWTPNAITVASFAIGVAAAACFALGSRAGLIAGAVLLQLSFTVDCVDGQLARYTRTFSKLGAWLDSVFDRTKEYVVYAGLAVGAARGFGDDVWLLAAVALMLQTVRHMSDFSYVTTQRRAVAANPAAPLERPEDAPSPDRDAVAPLADREPTMRQLLGRAGLRSFSLLRRSGLLPWGNRIIRMPIGERFALISLTAALASPRVTFVALLVWGGVAAAYAFAVRVLMSYDVPHRAARALLR